MNRFRTYSKWRRFARWCIAATFTLMGALAIGLVITVLLMEWMVGCGESYVDSKGESHQYACLFFNQGESK